MKTKWTKTKLIAFEDRVDTLFKAGKINAPVHLCGGNEEQLMTIFSQIRPKDYVFSTHRSHYHYLLKGGSEQGLLDEILGKCTGICKGKGRSMHIYDTGINFYTSGIVAGCTGIAVGFGLAMKKRFGGRKNKPHVWCFVGDGAEDSGHFMEAVRFGLGRALPLTFIVEDNDLAVESTKEERWHRYMPFMADNVIRYTYTRTRPHVGCGTHVDF